MKKPKCPYTFPHKSRAAKAAYICSIGGYYSREGRYPIEFDVSLYLADLDAATLWTRAVENGHLSDDQKNSAVFAACFRKAHHDIRSDALWEAAQEDCARSLMDADTYRMLWNGKEALDVTLGLHGRGGKHLIIEEFEGLTLRGKSEEELYETLMEQSTGNGWGDGIVDKPTLRKGYEWVISSRTLDTFYRYVRQCAVDFTVRKAAAELEYHAAFYLVQVAEAVYDTVFPKGGTENEGLVECAKLLYEKLDMTDKDVALPFITLCAAAGVDISDMVLGE